MPPAISDAPPVHWDRDVIFFANLLSLFFGNESQTRELAETVGELDSYGGRLLPVLNLLFRGSGGGEPANLLVLDREPDTALSAFFTGHLGLSLPELTVLGHDRFLDLATDGAIPPPCLDSRAAWIDGYVTDEILERIARRLGRASLSTAAGSHRGNNKLLLHRFLAAQGLPTVTAFEVADQNALAPAARDLARAGFGGAVLKAQVGASGIGMVKFPSLESLASDPPTVPDSYFFEGPCLLQGWLSPGRHGVVAVRSPSVQLFLGDRPGDICLFDITEQILGEGSIHEGNVSPAPYLGAEPAVRDELLRQAEVAARWLHGQGYRGTASADFLLATHDDGSPPTAYVCELNARVTGATYPSVLARHLYGSSGAWLLRNLRLDVPCEGGNVLADLAATGHLFQPGADDGILPINLNLDARGHVRKGQFLCLAPTPGDCHHLLELAASKLPTGWSPDRD